MAEKKSKSKEQQKRDLAKLAAAGAAAGYATSKIVKGKKRNKKAKRRATIAGFLMAILIVAVGAMYYFDIKPLGFLQKRLKRRLTAEHLVDSEVISRIVFMV